jgi:hypothetical protein
MRRWDFTNLLDGYMASATSIGVVIADICWPIQKNLGNRPAILRENGGFAKVENDHTKIIE